MISKFVKTIWLTLLTLICTGILCLQSATASSFDNPRFETGTVTLDDSLDWTTVSLMNSYSSTVVVFVTPVTAANCEVVGACAGNSVGGGGGMYPIPLIRNVSDSDFEIAMCVDGGNATCDTDPGISSETFHWFAFDVNDAANYDWIEVGRTTGVPVGGTSTAETYTTSFATTPDVWTQAQTYSQGSNIGAHAWVDPKSTTGFSYIGCVHTGTGDVCDGTATSETFGYLAIDVTNENFPSSVNFQSSMASPENSQWATGTFSPNYFDARVMVTQNSDLGGQDPQYSWARDLTTSNMEFRFCEEDSGTTCNTHVAENMYWFAVEGTSLIQVSGDSDLAVSSTIGLAINGTLQPDFGLVLNGSFSIQVGRPVNSGDIVTVFGSMAADVDEATSITKYDGMGDITSLHINRHVLQIGSDDNTSLGLTDLSYFDQNDSEDVMHLVTSGTNFIVDGGDDYTDDELEIFSGTTLNVGSLEGISGHDHDLDGSLTASGTLTFSGSWDATGGTFTSTNSTVLFTGSSAETITGTTPFYNIEFNNSAGVWELQNTLNVDGTLMLVAGTLDMNAGNDYTTNVKGNWIVTGTFVPQQGLVNLNGGDQMITNTGTFYNLQKIVSTSGTLTFGAGTTVGVENVLTLDGAPGQLLGLVSSMPGTDFNLNIPAGDQQVSYVNVSDSEALGNDILAVLSTNGGNNDDADVPPTDQWIFLTERYWVGPAGGNTSDPNNWSGTENACGVGGGAGVPTTLEVAIFSNTCSNNSTVDSIFNPGGMTIESGHAGTITTNALLDIDGPLTMEGGTLDLDTNDTNVNISGNMLISGGIYTAGSGVLTLDGVLAYNDTVGGVDIGNVTVDGTAVIVTLVSDMTVVDLTIESDDRLTTAGFDITVGDDVLINGQLDALTGAGGNTTINMSGDWDMTSGVFINTDSTVVFAGTSNVTSNSRSFNNVQIGSTGSGGTLNSMDDMDINGDFSVTNGGATTFNISNDTIRLSEDVDLANLDTFTIASSTVLFDGASAQTIASDAKTYNVLEVANTASAGISFTEAFTTTDFVNTTLSSIMKFQQSTTFTITGNLNLFGQGGSYIELDSINGVSQFTFDVSSDQVVSFVNVANSNATTSDITAASSINSGGNDDGGASPHWIFVTITPTIHDAAGSTQIAFNNIRQNSTRPIFRVSGDNVGLTFNRFQIELNTGEDFSGTAYTQTFSNTFDSDTQYDLTANGLSPSLPTTDGVTYYVRVRASADGGITWGVWSTENSCCGTWSYTYKSASGAADWFQSTDAQFVTGTLSDVSVTGTMSVRISGGYEAPKFESGDVTFDDSLSWTTVNLINSYSTAPVIIATPVTAANCEAAGACAGNSTSGGGGMYPIPIVRNVTTTNFEIAMCVDGGNTTCDTDPGISSETFHWFAFDVDDAENYDWIEVGTTTNVAVDGSGTAETYSTSFTGTPDVWTQAQTYSQGSDIGAHAWVDPKSASGFTFVGCVHTGTANDCDNSATNETFGYVAIDVSNEAFPAGVGFQSSSANIPNSEWTAATFSPSFTTPRVMVTQNTETGAEDGQYAWARNVITTGMDFRFCEQDDGTTCNTHNAEDVFWFAVEQHGLNTTGTLRSPAINYNNFAKRTAWDSVDWSELEVTGTISLQLYHTSSTTCDTLIPDINLSGNSSGFATGPVDISDLDTATYNEICMQALFTDDGTNTPYLEDWVVTFTERMGPLRGAVILVE